MKKIFYVLIALALVFRAVVMIVALANPERSFYSDDAPLYSNISLNLIEGNGFSDRETGPFVPNIKRVPVYPLFLSAARALSGRYYVEATVIAQNVLSVAAAFMLYLFLRRRYGVAGACAALFIMLADVAGIACANFLLSDVLFLFLSVAEFVLFLHLVESGKRYPLAVAVGAISAAMVLCRPIHLFFPYLLAVTGFFFSRRPRRRVLGPLALYIAVYIAGLSPWMLRNYITYGRWEITHLKAVQAYLFKAGGTIAIAENRNIEEVKADLERTARERFGIENIHEDPRSDELMEFTWETISAHPRAFLTSTAMGVGFIALTPDKGKISWIMGREVPGFGVLWQDSKSLSQIAATANRLGMLEIALLLFQAVLILCIYAAIVHGLFKRSFHVRDYVVVLSFLAIAYYFLLTAGPEVQGRYRIPAVPFLATLACVYVAGIVNGRRRPPGGDGS